jgi:hypothetical protein
MLRLASAGAGAGMLSGASQSTAGKVLAEQDRVDVGNRGPQMVARARALGHAYEAKYGHCAQCTIAALQDSVEFIPKSDAVFLAGSCLHGGATATGNANCGGFTGAGIVIGHLCGRSRARFGDPAAAKLASGLIREVAVRFERTYGSVICRDVHEKAGKNCPEVIAQAAGWAAEILLKRFSSQQRPLGIPKSG